MERQREGLTGRARPFWLVSEASPASCPATGISRCPRELGQTFTLTPYRKSESPTGDTKKDSLFTGTKPELCYFRMEPIAF
jgi:hypothetical protein